MRKILIWCAVALVAVFLLAILLIKILLSPATIEALVIPRIEVLLDRDIIVGKMELTIFSGVGVRIHDIQIQNRPPFASHPLATIESIDAKIGFFAMLIGKRRLKRVEISGFEALLVKDSLGRNNFDFSGEKPKEERESEIGSPELFCRQFEFRKGRLLFRNDSTGARMVLGNIELDYEIGRGEEAEFRSDLKIDSLWFRSAYGDFMLSPAALEAEIRADYFRFSDSLSLTECRWRVDKIRGRLDGSLSRFSPAPTINLRLLSERNDLLDFYDSKIVAAIPALRNVPLAGSLRIDVFCESRPGIQSSPIVRGKINITDALVKLPESKADLKMKLIECNFNEQSLSLFTEEATIAGNPLVFRLAIDTYSDPTFSGELRVAADAKLLREILDVDKNHEWGGEVDLSLSGFVRPTQRDQARLFGAVSLSEVSYSNPELTWSLDTLNLECSFSGGDAQLSRCDLNIGDNRLRLSGAISGFTPFLLTAGRHGKRPLFNFVLNSEHFNFDTLTSRSSGEADDTTLALHIWNQLFNLDASGDIRIDQGSFAGIEFHDLSTRASTISRIIHCDSLQCDLFGGECSADIVVDVADIMRPDFEVEYDCDDLRADSLLSRFTDFAGYLTGKIKAQGTLAGKGLRSHQIAATLTGDGKGKIDDGDLKDFLPAQLFAEQYRIEGLRREEYDDLEISFRLDNRSLEFRPLRFKSGKANYQVDGIVGFDGALDCRVIRTISKDDARTLIDLHDEKNFAQVRSLARAVFHIFGSSNQPTWRLDALLPKE